MCVGFVFVTGTKEVIDYARVTGAYWESIGYVKVDLWRAGELVGHSEAGPCDGEDAHIRMSVAEGR